jgi:hypothetical protein
MDLDEDQTQVRLWLRLRFGLRLGLRRLQRTCSQSQREVYLSVVLGSIPKSVVQRSPSRAESLSGGLPLHLWEKVLSVCSIWKWPPRCMRSKKSKNNRMGWGQELREVTRLLRVAVCIFIL